MLKNKKVKNKLLSLCEFIGTVKEAKAERADNIAKCLKLGPKTKKALKSFGVCSKVSGHPSMPNAIGECAGDKASVYFYNDKKECEAARAEALEGAST